MQTVSMKVARSRKLQQKFVALVKKADPPKIEVKADADPKGVAGAQVWIDGEMKGQAPIDPTFKFPPLPPAGVDSHGWVPGAEDLAASEAAPDLNWAPPEESWTPPAEEWVAPADEWVAPADEWTPPTG